MFLLQSTNTVGGAKLRKHLLLDTMVRERYLIWYQAYCGAASEYPYDSTCVKKLENE